MKRLCFLALLLPVLLRAAPVEPENDKVPEPLRPWEAWATWDDKHRHCPTPWSDATKHLCFWPSKLELKVDRAGAQFALGLVVYGETWVGLPGSAEAWPQEVKANGEPVPVVERNGAPAVKLAPGTYRLEGVHRWADMPQRLALPREIGILALTLDGQPVAAPVWDAQGLLWLRRDGSTEEADKDFLAVKIASAIEDGIPLWWRTEIELTVSGKSREESLGHILPEGWKLAAVESPIPVAVDDAGRAKAQVRAGKWTLRAEAFRFDRVKEIRYAAGTQPAVKEQLVAFRSKPDLRLVEIVGAPSIDVSQTAFPDRWRELPVYRWDTAASFTIEERLRGMGEQKPAGLSIARVLWLDEDGAGLTFRDAITGQAQQIWRLDAAAGQDLGSVRSAGQGQLITRNPQSGAPGVEIRTRALDLDATGRMARGAEWSATGWQADAESLKVTLHLPPGWRLLALFGADWVQGDWLTAWTLLDLFLLLVFTLAVFRLWGFGPALVAFFAFAISYHEPGAPRYAWILLLVPLALLRVVPEGWGKRVVNVGKWVTVAIFVLVAVPFVARQVQQALYPQLEVVGAGHGYFLARTAPADFEAAAAPVPAAEASVRSRSDFSLGVMSVAPTRQAKAKAKDNLLYEAEARIQTGPGVPEWQWRPISLGWNGPVQATQQIHPILIPLNIERALTALRVVLLVVLAGILLGARKLGGEFLRPAAKAAAVLLVAAGFTTTAHAQFPDAKTIEKLRERLLAPSDAYPNAAEIPSVALQLNERRLVIDAEIHTAIQTAVPLPGRLPAWSPVSVSVDEKPDTAALRREDGYLWIVLPAGVHRVRVEGTLAALTEWEWSFLLKPRRVTIDAPGWTFSGVRPDGVPEPQVFFTLQQKAAAGQTSYDRQDLQSVAQIERSVEIGLVWQLHTTVRRLSPSGRAIALRVPLLPGENVLTSGATVRDGFIDVRLGAQESEFSWESGLAVAEKLPLATRADDAWVERWRLVASPVWNVALAGLAPVFEPADAGLVPVWQPWPGESVELTISRPAALAGATVTVNRAMHQITLGKRQRVSKLDLALRSSLGEDFLIDLPAGAEVTSLELQGKAIPVRKDGARLIVPLRPGEQTVSIGWKINEELASRATVEEVRLPVESANANTFVTVPGDRWVLAAHGPTRGPAVRFWGILALSVIAAFVLARVAHSPLKTVQWILLAIGLTQVPLPAALVVVGWFFFLAWRGRESFLALSTGVFNLLQVALIALTVAALGILLVAVGEGLLGRPEMFITGNGSHSSLLRWYQARTDTLLPRPAIVTVSIWGYRLLMLAWALWLAASLIRWLRWGWEQFASGGILRKKPKAPPQPPPLPVQG